MSASVIIGKDRATGQEVTLSQEARELSTYIIGIKRSGKSTLLEHIALGDILNGDGLCFLDPHGDSAEKLLQAIPKERAGDVIFWDASDTERPFGFNPFYAPDFDDAGAIANEFLDFLHNLEEFREAFKNAPRMNEVLRNLATTFVVNQGYTLAEAPLFLQSASFRQRFYDKLLPHYSQVRRFWSLYDARDASQREDFGPALNKLRRFESSRTMRALFGQPQNSINFREAMDEGKVIIVKLPDRIGRDDASFIGAYLIWDIARAMFSRSGGGKRRKFHILADEFPRFMTTTFARIQDEGSKFGVDVVVAHQNRGQIDDDKLKGSTVAVGNKIVFRVSGKDGAELAPEFKLTIPEGRTTERPRYALVSNVLEFLSSGRHEDRAVLDTYEKLRMHLDELYARILNAARVGAVELRPKLVAGKRSSERAFDRAGYDRQKEQFERQVEELERLLNRILFFMMGAQNDAQITTWGQSGGGGLDRLCEALDRLYSLSNLDREWFGSGHLGYVFQVGKLRAFRRERGKVGDGYNRTLLEQITKGGEAGLWEWTRSELERCQQEFRVNLATQAESDVSWLRQSAPSPETLKLRWSTAYSLDAWEAKLHTLVFVLGYLLCQHPCYAPVGQLEKVTERERVYSDVANEVANMLSNLPQYVALCTVVANREPVQYTLEPKEPITAQEKSLSEDIRTHSRETFGRDRHEVEAEIRRRLGEGGGSPLGSPQSAPPPPDEPPAAPAIPDTQAPDDDPYDEEGPIRTPVIE
ncbi:hypothetical protein SE17_05280 [Kouleothrix aurantiaca]|uniref:Type IV secretion system coupling protein TraD DNA-binding domain-containing protein n=1 Tax=Kouleothrix aurantiaca TaxID=186479 RepID=A0A0N8PT06_9CHLR|nr:hypothetical protein SE17_05280 [Kouleothrix aurantiaca]